MSFDAAASSLAQLRYMEEAPGSWGETPIAGPGAANLRMTGESLNIDLKKTASEEIEASRQISSLFVTDLQANGGFNFELSYSEYDKLLAGLMMANWSAFGTEGVSGDHIGSIDVTDPTKDVLNFDVDPAGNDALAGIAVGQWIRLAAGGTGTAPNALSLGVRRVIGRTNSLLELEKAAGGVADAAKTFKIFARRVTHGTTKKSFTLEKEFSDVGQIFYYRGMMVSKMSLSMKGGAAVTGSFDFLGRDGNRVTSTTLPGTIEASYAHPVISAVTGVKNVRMAGESVNSRYQTYLREMTLDYDNALGGLDALGELGNVGIRLGTIGLKGSFQAYLNDGSMYDDFIDSITQSLSFVLVDTLGQGYAITITNIDMETVKIVAGKKDESVVLEVNWTALKEAASGQSMFIDKL